MQSYTTCNKWIDKEVAQEPFLNRKTATERIAQSWNGKKHKHRSLVTKTLTDPPYPLSYRFSGEMDALCVLDLIISFFYGQLFIMLVNPVFLFSTLLFPIYARVQMLFTTTTGETKRCLASIFGCSFTHMFVSPTLYLLSQPSLTESRRHIKSPAVE